MLFCATLFAQNKFYGKVLNERNDAPVAGASVYFNNTSIGAVTNEKGEFVIQNAISGDVIISSVGYERIVHKIKTGELTGRSFTFKLTEKESMLRDVVVLPDATRKKFLNLFIENFLGMTEEADMSRITNLNALSFSVGNEKNAFEAFSDTPLTIINKRLGYIIRFDLVEFSFNQNSGSSSFYGYTRYEEMGDKKRWAKNRRKAYYGSTLHFYRSLIHNELKKENFEIFVIRQDSLKKIDPDGKISYSKADMGMLVSATDIVKRDTIHSAYRATWKDRLMVQYYKNPDSKAYLSRKHFISGLIPNGTRSYLKLTTDHVYIDDYGILENPLSIFCSGYWIYEKAANLLPYNYSPEKNN